MDDTIEIVSAYADTMDPAIDVKASKIERYRERRDPRDLVFLPGMQPVKFRLRPLKKLYLGEVVESQHGHGKIFQAFLACCHEIAIPGEPQPMRPKSLHEDQTYGVHVAPRSWVEEVADRFSLVHVYEIGLFCIKRAQLSKAALGPFDWSDG
jgi:hypothetical protein